MKLLKGHTFFSHPEVMSNWNFSREDLRTLVSRWGTLFSGTDITQLFWLNFTKICSFQTRKSLYYHIQKLCVVRDKTFFVNLGTPISLKKENRFKTGSKTIQTVFWTIFDYKMVHNLRKEDPAQMKKYPPEHKHLVPLSNQRFGHLSKQKK